MGHDEFSGHHYTVLSTSMFPFPCLGSSKAPRERAVPNEAQWHEEGRRSKPTPRSIPTKHAEDRLPRLPKPEQAATSFNRNATCRRPLAATAEAAKPEQAATSFNSNAACGRPLPLPPPPKQAHHLVQYQRNMRKAAAAEAPKVGEH